MQIERNELEAKKCTYFSQIFSPNIHRVLREKSLRLIKKKNRNIHYAVRMQTDE